MPRPARFLLSESFYHVMTRGNNRNVVFKSAEDYEYFLKLVLKYKLEHPFDLYHYCLMPNHTHFLIQTKKAFDFSTFMKKLNLAYFHHYRREYGWVGHFWQDRFKSQAIGKDAHFIQCGKYIELNPVRAGIVENPDEYQYSSYAYYAQGKTSPPITTDFIYEEIGHTTDEKQERYRKLVIDQVIEDSYNRAIWGSDLQRYREQDKVNRKTNKV